MRLEGPFQIKGFGLQQLVGNREPLTIGRFGLASYPGSAPFLAKVSPFVQQEESSGSHCWL